MRVAVVGGGISGLSAAYEIRELFAERNRDLDLTIFEGDSRPGGKIRSEHLHGFTLEWGPNGFLDSKPATVDLCRPLGLEGDLLKSSDAARKRYLNVQGELHRLPESPPAFLKSPLLTWRGKLRLLGEIAVRQKGDDLDETIAAFAERRLGKEALTRLIGPMVAGIYAGDPRKLSLPSSFKRIHELESEYGGLFRGMLGLMQERRKHGGPAGPGGTLTSFGSGTERLIDALAASFDGHLRLGTRVVGLERDGEGWRLTVVRGGARDQQYFDKVVFAVPMPVIAKVFESLDEKLAQAAAAIPYAAVAVLGLGYPREAFENALDGFGYLTSLDTKSHLLGCLWTSFIFPGARSPKEHVLLRVMVGGSRMPEEYTADDHTLIARVRCEVEETLRIRRAPVFTRLVRWDQAIPQYTIGHGRRVAAIEKALGDMPGIHIGGNGLYGVGMNDCTADALRLRQGIEAELG